MKLWNGLRPWGSARTPERRALSLEREIRRALRRHDLVLTKGVFLQLSRQDPCCCAIGAAVAATARSRAALRRRADGIASSSGNARGHAASVVDAGMTVLDLAQLEAGFEGWSTCVVPGCYEEVDADPCSPFHELGLRLRHKAERDGTYRGGGY